MTSTTAVKEADIVLYAQGGGMGHLVRAASIAHAIKRLAKIEPCVLVSTEFFPLFKNKLARLEVIELADDADLSRKIILKKLRDLSPELLVVDALPMGLMGELGEFFKTSACRKVLIARCLRQDYRRNMNIENFVRANYDLVIRVEKFSEDELSHPKNIEVSPILSCGFKDIFSRTEARSLLAVPKSKFLVMVVSTLKPEETDDFFQMAHTALMRTGNPKTAIKFVSSYGDPSPAAAHTSYFPIMRLMHGADLIVGHGGYNLVHETRALNVPMAVLPLKKLYDDQEARVRSYLNDNLIPFRSPDDLENILRKFLNMRRMRTNKPKFANGAEEAARAILDFHNSL